MKIGELARQTGTPAQTIRYYEKEQLLPAPARTGGNYRHYSPHHLERLLFIRQCRALDLSLQEIRSLLEVKDNPAASCSIANQLLDEHIARVENHIKGLQKLAYQLHQLRAQCASDVPAAECGILQGLTCEQNAGPFR